MEQFSLFLFKSAIWLSTFTVVYLLLLKNERFHLLKRIYLLSGMVVSLTFPLINFHAPLQENVTSAMVAGTLTDDVLQTGLIQQISYMDILYIIFIGGAAIMFIRLLVNTLIFVLRIIKSEPIHEKGAKIVYSDKVDSSYSFFNFIFMKPSLESTEKRVILNHELGHIRQRHWIDLLISEILAILQWANPFMWLYSVFVRQNHEYLADEEAIKQTDPGTYKAVLINHMFKTNVFALSNPFSYSLNKRRFDMMKKCEIPAVRKLRVLVVVPLLALLSLAFSEPAIVPEALSLVETTLAEEKEETPFVIVEEMPYYPGGNVALLKYVAENINYPRKARNQNIQGRVFLRFVVDTKGNIGDVEILRGVDPLINAEAIRVVKSIKGFVAGKQGGVPVNVYYQLPINFALED